MTPTYPGTGQPMTAGVLADGSTVNHLTEHGRTVGLWENVKHYGAYGDNSHDDTAAITAAIAAASSSNIGTVYFPQGLYKITSTINLNSYHHIRFLGHGTKTSDAVGGLVGNHAIINSQSITTGPAFSFDGSVNQETAGHLWENIVIAAGRTGWKYKDASSIRFTNSGGSVLSDGNADNAPVLIINSFWVQFYDGTYDAPSTTTPAVILRGTAVDFDVASTYLVHFKNVRFNFGAVQQEWTAGGGAGSTQMENCDVEGSARAILKIVGPDPGSPSYLDFIRLRDCRHFDQAGDAPIIELDAPNIILLRPLIEDCGQEVGATGIKVTNGSVQMARIMGAPHTQDGAFAVNSSGKVIGSIRDRDNGTDFVGQQVSESTTAITSKDGPMFRFAVDADDYARAGVSVSGTYYWGPGGSTNTGWDTQLSRSAANVLSLGSNDAIITGAAVHGSLPSAASYAAGAQFYCTTDKKPVWSDGSAHWVDAAGANHT